MTSVPQTTAQPFVAMQTTPPHHHHHTPPHHRHCCFYICPGVSLVNISLKSCSRVQHCQIVTLFTYYIQYPQHLSGFLVQVWEWNQAKDANSNNNRVEISLVRAKSTKPCNCFLISNW